MNTKLKVYDEKIIAKIPAEDKQAVVRLADEMDVPISYVVRQSIRMYVSKMQEELKQKEDIANEPNTDPN